MKKSQLRIVNWKLPVYLGVGEVERQFLQILEIDIDIDFKMPPKGGENDFIENTVCYDQMIQELNARFKNQSFHLIESVATQIYDLIKAQILECARMYVRVKKKPSLVGLAGYLEYGYGDEPFSSSNN